MKKDYTRYNTKTLLTMQDEAFSAYYREAVKPCGNWRPGIRFPALEKATKRLHEISDEITRRMEAGEDLNKITE